MTMMQSAGVEIFAEPVTIAVVENDADSNNEPKVSIEYASDVAPNAHGRDVGLRV